MEKLLAGLSMVGPVAIETENKIRAAFHICRLERGGSMPEGLPDGTWIFVEDGFIQLMGRRKNKWNYEDLFPENASLLLTASSTIMPKEGCIRIRALEPSVLYYLSREEAIELGTGNKHFGIFHTAMLRKSISMKEEMHKLWQQPTSMRLKYVEKHFHWFFRAGPVVLTEFLQLTKKDAVALQKYF